MVWANFLHIYQPPTQYPHVVKQIVEEAYDPLITILERNPSARLTLNINASLTKQLALLGYTSLINRIAAAAKYGQIEFTGSAAFHALLPRLPEEEIKQQINRNLEINRFYFGQTFSPKGFFPPEMAYSEKVAKVVSSLGYDWIILSEDAIPSGLQKATAQAHTIAGTNLSCVFRDKPLSLHIAFNKVFSVPHFEDLIREQYGESGGVITAIDGETFGHHNKHQEKILELIYGHHKALTTVPVSQFVAEHHGSQSITPEPSSWSMLPEDKKENVPYPLWDSPHNPVHPLQWELTNLAIHMQKIHPAPADNPVRDLLDRALHSDQYWWASGRPYWRLDMIERGASMLRDVVFQTPYASEAEKNRARVLYVQLMATAEQFKGKAVIDIPKR